MIYKEIIKEALLSENYIDEIQSILIGIAYYKNEDRRNVLKYVIQAFQDACLSYASEPQKLEFCSNVELKLKAMLKEEEHCILDKIGIKLPTRKECTEEN